jgi:metal-responsive CopG/Arc/MetJ family transcriptional regulator
MVAKEFTTMGENAAKVSISLPLDLLSFVDTAAKNLHISRSGFITRLLREKVEEQECELMIEGYRSMAKENRRLAEEHLPVAMEVWADGD